MTMVLHDDRAPGPDTCSGCGGAVVRAIDEFFRLVVLDVAPVDGGTWLYGSEYFTAGGEPDQAIRARRATGDEAPGPRWRLHVCPLVTPL